MRLLAALRFSSNVLKRKQNNIVIKIIFNLIRHLRHSLPRDLLGRFRLIPISILQLNLQGPVNRGQESIARIRLQCQESIYLITLSLAINCPWQHLKQENHNNFILQINHRTSLLVLLRYLGQLPLLERQRILKLPIKMGILQWFRFATRDIYNRIIRRSYAIVAFWKAIVPNIVWGFFASPFTPSTGTWVLAALWEGGKEGINHGKGKCTTRVYRRFLHWNHFFWVRAFPWNLLVT